MTKLPYLFEMDPDQWLEKTRKAAEELQTQIADAFGKHEDPEELHQALWPVLEEYFIDPDEPTDDELTAKVKGENFYIGQKDGGDWLGLTFHDGGYWWLRRREPENQERSPEEIHDELATKVVQASWGNPERYEERAKTQKAKRTILEPYLKAIDEAGGTEAKAADIRAALRAVVEFCIPADDDVSVEDRSPDDDHTHFVIVRGGDEEHVLAVSPGASRAPEKLSEAFDIEISADAGVRIVTDHLRFVWYPFLNTQLASSDLLLPSETDEELVVDYNFAIDRAVSLLLRSLNL